MARANHWCLTINNYTEQDRQDLINYDTTYLIIGDEVGENGTPHLQVYLRTQKRVRFSQIKRAFPRAHIEMKSPDSTVEQASDYCKKEGTFAEFGTLPKTGGQTTKEKYDHAWECATSGNLDDVCPELRIKHYRTLQKIAMDHMTALPSEDNCTGLWIYGPSGTGKSTYARSLSDNYYLKASNKWWDGYQGEEIVIIEDLGKEHECLGHHLKLWCDKWDFIAECKGSSIRIRPKKIVITTQYSIEEIFNDQKTRDALNRRCVKKLIDCRLEDSVE